MNRWAHYKMDRNRFPTDQSVKLGLLLTKRSRCFCNKILTATSSVVSELLRLHRAKPFNRGRKTLYHLGRTCQDTELPVPPTWAHHPPPRPCKRWGRTHWEGEDIFNGEELSVCCIIRHTSAPPLERGDWWTSEAGATRTTEDRPRASRWASNCASVNTEGPDIKLHQVRPLFILDPWPASFPPPIPLTTAGREGWGGARSQDETH